MGQIAQIIVAPGKLCRAFGERLLAGIKPEQFARKASVNGTIIDANHPAWVYGHLATYPAKIAAMVGLEGSSYSAPAGFEELFRDKTECRDDPKGSIYPSMEAVTTAFFRTHDALFEALASVEDSKLLVPTLDEKARQRFPLVGSRVLFMCNNHLMMHFGQVSTWRRCMGLPAA